MEILEKVLSRISRLCRISRIVWMEILEKDPFVGFLDFLELFLLGILEKGHF